MRFHKFPPQSGAQTGKQEQNCSPSPAAVRRCVKRALALDPTPAAWQALMQRPVVQRLSWQGPAHDDLAL